MARHIRKLRHGRARGCGYSALPLRGLGRRVESPDGRQGTVESLDLDEAELAGAGAQSVAQYGARQTGAAVVVEAHNVAVGDAARSGVVRMDAHRLAALDLRRKARGAEIQLAVQSGRRLVGDQLQRKTR